MVRISIELIRKRSEHNEGEIHSLEELALHQEKIEKIEMLDKLCPGLKILLLQNNVIPKIENVGRLRHLEYLNLALNNIQVIENLSGCESLKKLDLTLNFVGQLSSIRNLKSNRNLENLYLVGNPCVEFKGYRDYIVAELPNLKALDGIDITKSDRIRARQIIGEVELDIKEQEEQYLAKQIELRKKAVESEEAEATTSEDFWSKTTSNTIEDRVELQKQLERQEEERKPKPTVKKKVPRKLQTEDGRILNVNEAKVSFSLHDEYTRNILVLDIALPKHMDSSLIDANIEPGYVRITIKGKIFQLVLPEEVLTESSYAQRSKMTGHLVITMPKLHETSSTIWSGSRSAAADSQQSPIDVAANMKRINSNTEKPGTKSAQSQGETRSPTVNRKPKLKAPATGKKCATCEIKHHGADDPNIPPLI